MFVSFEPSQTYPVDTGHKKFVLHAGKKYILHHTWTRNFKGKSNPANIKNYKINENASNKKILFLRSLGYGDLLFLSPIAELIKDNYRSCQIDFCTLDNDILPLINCVSNSIPFPIEEEVFNSYDYHFVVADLSELEKTDKNVYEMYLEHLGYDDPVTKVAPIFKAPIISPFFVTKDYNKRENRIGLHPFSTDKIRSLNPELTNNLINRLLENNYEVVLFSNQKEKDEFNNQFNLNNKITWSIDKEKEFSRLPYIMGTCSQMICVDSSILHLSQGLRIPTIALYGSFSSESRIKYYNRIKVIDTYPDCRCFKHGLNRCPKDYGKPYCMNIHPDIIMELVKGREFNLTCDVYETKVNFYNC